MVRDHVTKLHSNEQDLVEGDLLHRVDRFDRYVIATIPVSKLDLFEFAVAESMVEECMEQFLCTGTHPRVVFDAVAGSMIDGSHRANALARCGLTEIDAYVGIHENVDPHWCQLDADADEDEEAEQDSAGDELSSDEVVFLRRLVGRSSGNVEP